jgi:hypothetical protein
MYQVGTDVVIGLESSEHIRISVLSYERQVSDNSDDSNWLSSKVSVSCGPWNGHTFSANLETNDFSRFLAGLTKLNENLRGEAVFETLEGQIKFRLSGNGIGGIEVQGEAISTRVHYCALSFGYSIDQMYLRRIINQVRAITTRYPVQ